MADLLAKLGSFSQCNNAEGGEKDMFSPGNGYRKHYLKILGAAGK